MSEVGEHYENLLAEHYTWMRGGYDSKVSEYRRLLEGAEISPRSGGKVLDLGAGSGFQSIALADIGFEVLAVDTSEKLLKELRARGKNKLVRAVRGDMLDAASYKTERPFEVAVCMGDTLTHLQSLDEVEALFGNIREVLEEDGKLILEFRDLCTELRGTDRAIPVRLDEGKIMVTFLEYEADHVNVHDLIFVNESGNWTMRKSAYPKLRLGADDVLKVLGRTGFGVVERFEDRGFSVVIGQKQLQRKVATA